MTKNVNVRFDDETHARLKAAAERDGRSLNGELLWLLRRELGRGEREARWPGGRVPEEDLGELAGSFDLPELKGEA